MRFADVAFPIAVRSLFTYSVPETLTARLQPGMRVFVPFQRTMKAGTVVRLHETTPDFAVKPVREILDLQPVFSEEQLQTALWMSRFYYCGTGECLDAMIPAGLSVDSTVFVQATDRTASASGKYWSEVRFALESAGAPVSLKHLERQSGAPATWVLRQIHAGLLERTWSAGLRMETARYERLEAAASFTAEAVYAALRSKKKLPKWASGALHLLESGLLPATSTELKEAGYPADLVRRLETVHGWLIRSAYAPDLRVPKDVQARLNPLNESQQEALNALLPALREQRFEAFLLNGITGSGKTEIYLHAMAETVARGRGAVLLIPEIALTPQTVRRFQRVFGDAVAVLHSRLTDRERLNEWEHLRSGRKQILIGARSAVFAPVQSPGLFILDEEHDPSFKQSEPSPRYHAREVALVRARALNAVVIAGSATPSLNALHAAQSGKMKQLNLKVRHGAARLPPVQIIDLNQYRSGMFGPLAAPLYLALEEELGAGNQAILLLNRRGYAPYLQCRACGEIPGCPHCSVTLTFHRAGAHLRCHYCGYAEPAGRPCAKCASDDLQPEGRGTQQLEEELQALFPGAGMLRLDLDTLSSRDAHEALLGQFARKEAQLLIGTQVVAKGHDFPDVTLAGVINADTELAFPGYRSGERMFSMLAQVAGRAGRAGKPGRVFIQTRRPDLSLLVHAAHHDHTAFAREEMERRQLLAYPPFSRLLKLVCRDADPQKPEPAGNRLASLARTLLPAVPVLGPAPSLPYKRLDRYYWDVLIKLPPASGPGMVEQFLDALLGAYRENLPAGLSSTEIIPLVDPLE